PVGPLRKGLAVRASAEVLTRLYCPGSNPVGIVVGQRFSIELLVRPKAAVLNAGPRPMPLRKGQALRASAEVLTRLYKSGSNRVAIVVDFPFNSRTNSLGQKAAGPGPGQSGIVGWHGRLARANA